MSSGQPIFSDVIDITLDTASLEQSLDSFVALYRSKMEELSGINPASDQVSNLVNVAQISQDLAQVRDEIKTMTDAFIEGFGAVAAASGDTSTVVAANVTNSLATVDAAVGKSAKLQLEQLALVAHESDQAYADFATAAQSALSGAVDPATLKTTALLKELFRFIDSGGEAAFADLTARQQDWFINYQQVLAKSEDSMREFYASSEEASQQSTMKQIALQESAARQMEADFALRAKNSEFYDADSEAFQVMQQREVAAVEEATRLMQADFAKRAESSQFYEAGSDEFQTVQMREVAAVEEATRLMQADFAKREQSSQFYDSSSDEFQKVQQKEVAAVKQATAEMETDFKKRAEASSFYDAGSEAFQIAQQKMVSSEEEATRLMLADFKNYVTQRTQMGELTAAEFEALQGQQLEIAQQAIMRRLAMEQSATREMETEFKKRAAANESASSEEGNSGLLSGAGSQFANLAKIQVEWQLINLAIQATLAPLKGVVDFFKTGVDYAAEMETKAADLQGILASNVKLSEDQATNFKLSGQAAVQVQQAIQDASIKYGIAVDVLDRGFKSFVDSGGASLTNSIGDTTKVVVLLGAALKASGKDADATRSMLAEYPKLLDGTISSSSKILETLGLTKDQWMAIRAEAEKHHDLLEQLTPLLSKYQQVAEDSANRFDAIKETIGLIYDRTADLMAQQFWPTLKEDLQIIRDSFAANKEQIDACAVAIGQFVKDTLQLSDTTAMMGTILTTFKMLAEILIELERGFTILNLQSEQFVLSMKLAGTFSIDNAKSYVQQIKDLQRQIELADTAAASKTQRMLHPDETRLLDASSTDINDTSTPALDDPLLPGGKTPPTDPKAEIKAESTALKQLMADYAEKDRQQQDSFNKQKQNIELLKDERKISADEASKQLTDLTDKYLVQQRAAIDATRAMGDSLSKVPQNQKIAFDSRLDTRSDAVTKQSDAANYAAHKAGVDADNKLLDDSLAHQEQALKQGAASALAIIKSKVSSSTLLESQGITARMAVEEKLHTDLQAVYAKELQADGANSDLKQKTIDKEKAEDAAYTASVVANSYLRQAAQLKELEQQYDTLNKIDKAQQAASATQIEAARQGHASNLEAEVDQQKLLQLNLGVVTLEKARADAAVRWAEANGVVGKSLDALLTKQAALNQAQNEAKVKSDNATDQVGLNDPISKPLHDAYSDFKGTFDNFGDNATKFAVSFDASVKDVSTAINAFSQAGSKLASDISSGNTTGAVGDGLGIAGGIVSSMSKAFSSAPIIGSIIGAVGPLLSGISAIFTAAAQRIADDIKKSFDVSVQAYQQGSSTLAATIAAVQQERDSAVAQLSGQKGGQAQLDKLLPTIDSELSTLKQQQTQIIANFDTSLQKLQMGSDVLSTTLDTWNSINQSVKDYVNAGGDAAKAAQFLSLSLQQLQTDAATNLSSGENDAITKAIALNDLLTQRVQLTKDYNTAKFATLNADALERRASNAVTVGTDQTAADAAYKTQLDDLNQQIATATTEVNLYKQIYNIASDTASLKAESSQLEIDNLNTTIQKLKDYQTVYNSIYKNPDGTYGTNNAAGTAGTTTTNTIGTVNVVVNTSGSVDGTTIAQSISDALNTKGRYGAGTTVQSTY